MKLIMDTWLAKMLKDKLIIFPVELIVGILKVS